MDELFMPISDPTRDDLISSIIKEEYDNRRIIINEDISESLLETICLYILKFNAEDKDIPREKRRPILIILNSNGGSVTFGLTLIDCIMQSITPVNCLVIGMAASMACYIPVACDTTYIMPNGIICIHDGNVGLVQTSNKAKDTMKFFNDCDKRLHEILINNTNVTEEFLEEISDREYYIFSDKAKELGIVDKIIGVDCTLDEVI